MVSLARLQLAERPVVECFVVDIDVAHGCPRLLDGQKLEDSVSRLLEYQGGLHTRVSTGADRCLSLMPCCSFEDDDELTLR